MQLTTPISNITVLACLSLIVTGGFKDLDELAKLITTTIQGVQASLTKYPIGWRLQITGDNNAYPTDAHSLVEQRIKEGLLVSVANQDPMPTRLYRVREPVPVAMVDRIIHTDDHPFCDDPECPCQEEADRRAEEYERRYIELGRTERYDALPWRATTDYSFY